MKQPKPKPVRCWAVITPFYFRIESLHLSEKSARLAKVFEQDLIAAGRFVPDPPKKKGRGRK